MKHRTNPATFFLSCVFALLLLPTFALSARAQTPAFTILPQIYGPYSGHFLAGGTGLTKPLPEKDPVLTAASPWTLSAWVEMASSTENPMLIGGVGDPLKEDSRFFVIIDGKPALRLGKKNMLTASAPLSTQPWHLLAASFDGDTVRLYVDGAEAAHGTLRMGAVQPQIELAPVDTPWSNAAHFGGRIALFTLDRHALSPEEIATLARQKPDFQLIAFEEGSKPWPIQTIQWAGYTAPQDPSTLPHSTAPFSTPKAAPLPPAKTTLQPSGEGDWTLSGGWRLTEAPKVTAAPEEIAKPGFDTKGWMAATVPGTVLTTMIDRGIYPDPDYGLNNLAIPESLNKQDYWYRSEFEAPKFSGNQHMTLVLDGINYHAEVWLNGQHVGAMTGAFIRGVFDVTNVLRSGQKNALAILVSPAPHPGIPNEQSILNGSGLNGGALCLDGPTFMATEGWDWMPAIRDRDTGLWQNVHLLATGRVEIEDTQVITRLPLPDISQAYITVNIPLKNVASEPVHGKLTASFEGVIVSKEITVAPGESTVSLQPAEFPQLHLQHPRLWWPNGYGKPELYHLTVDFVADSGLSEEKKTQFGVREVTYELSLLDNTGHLRRVDYDPSVARNTKLPVVDVTHAGMRQIPNGWASSITAGADASPAFHTVADTRATPYLLLKVNGVRIATRGGNWGMDDTRKRISRAHLEPFFRFDRDANLNIIRNWQGQNSEEVFYQLADKYGMMVWNDFWEVTQDSNVEAEDPALFLKNARDTILRYRNHPSIVMWCGRNEGVPQPVINQGLIRLTHTLDGTRYYSPSSNRVNLQPSGPYSYQDPVNYYTKLNPGFAVETGTPSLPTLEWFHRWLPKADQWPISDDWAYHDWHPDDPFNQHLQTEFGAASNLADYVRKGQMLNYVEYRAVFEGFNAHLWAPNSGRLLWMTQPAWPSTLWGILTSDYDTQASFYGTKKACEPIHVQLDLSNNNVAVINTTRTALPGLSVSARVYSLDSKLLLSRDMTVDAAADSVTPGFSLALAPLMGDSVVFVQLQLHGQNGRLLSDNFYWRAASDAGYRALDQLAPATVTVTARLDGQGDNRRVQVHLKNSGNVAALANKLILLRAADGSELLPAYYSDNYISLLPGQEASVTIYLPADLPNLPLRIHLRGWNATQTTEAVTQ
ncbi:MAG TPA: LamG-like jellyroll fold domain-containing protein [Acidobacteriaceae bacterium]|jgi:hypothetical protein|nr:LamG-like jellyroll fold domain-containing protein [Acidobacteriaceae bacterium]